MPGLTCIACSASTRVRRTSSATRGCVVTDDVIRSLAISQRLMGTREIILIHHTDCGMLTFNDDDFRRGIQDEIGAKPPWAPESFPDVVEDVRQSLRRIENSPFVIKHESLRGFDFDVASSKLDEVALSRPCRLPGPWRPACRPGRRFRLHSW